MEKSANGIRTIACGGIVMKDIKFRVWDYDENEFWGEGKNLKLISLVSDSLANDDTTVLEQYVGIKDVKGVEVFEGDIVQPIRTYEFNNIDTDLEPTKLPIVVEHGNYVFGKWIAREVNEDRLGVIDYYLPSEVVVVGNIHE